MKCPHCQGNIDVQFIKAPANAQQAASATGNGLGDIGELLNSINDDTLSGAAASFVRETRERYDKYKERIRFSDKQLSWLKSIAAGEGQDW